MFLAGEFLHNIEDVFCCVRFPHNIEAVFFWIRGVFYGFGLWEVKMLWIQVTGVTLVISLQIMWSDEALCCRIPHSCLENWGFLVIFLGFILSF
jgi:hypothetical protein